MGMNYIKINSSGLRQHNSLDDAKMLRKVYLELENIKI